VRVVKGIALIDDRLNATQITVASNVVFTISISYEILMASRVILGRTMYETDRAPATWVPRLNGMDRIWVPTVFHKNAFAKSGVDPSKLVVLPEAVDVAFFNFL